MTTLLSCTMSPLEPTHILMFVFMVVVLLVGISLIRKGCLRVKYSFRRTMRSYKLRKVRREES